MGVREIGGKVRRGLREIFAMKRPRSSQSVNGTASTSKAKKERESGARPRSEPTGGASGSWLSPSFIYESVCLETVLNDDELLQSFTNFCHLQHCCENLHFFEAAQQFRIKHADASPEVRMIVGQKIFSRYIKDNACEWVCLPPSISRELETRFACCHGVGSDSFESENLDHDELAAAASPSVFDAAQRQVWGTLQSDVLPRYVSMLLSSAPNSPDSMMTLMKILQLEKEKPASINCSTKGSVAEMAELPECVMAEQAACDAEKLRQPRTFKMRTFKSELEVRPKLSRPDSKSLDDVRVHRLHRQSCKSSQYSVKSNSTGNLHSPPMKSKALWKKKRSSQIVPLLELTLN